MITTADERTWRTDRPILFLGEWCRLYERRHAWEKLDAVVAPYHWDDREKLFHDYRYLVVLYERLLKDLSEVLNQYHGVNHSLRYWRILIGPWLGYFTQILFDRWAMIERTVGDFSLNGHFSMNILAEEMIPNDFQNFIQMFVNDMWNHYTYSYILDNYHEIKCEVIDISLRKEDENPTTASLNDASSVGRFKRRISERILRTGLLSSQHDCFFINTYLPTRTNLLLQLCLGQIPKLWRQAAVPKIDSNMKQRKCLGLASNSEKDFEHCARSMIFRQIPVAYLEGYHETKEFVETLGWPAKPRVIFTSNSHNHDDVFKLWAAEKTSSGSVLVIGQHGGHYGCGLWSFNEDHETEIADHYLSWGWKDCRADINPVGALKLFGAKRINWDPEGGILLVTSTFPRYSYWMYSIVIGPQTLTYFDEQFRFIEALGPELRHRTTVRTDISAYGWGQVARWKDRFPDLDIDSGTTPIDDLVKDTRVYVSTYNATTFLEALAQNIPTIMFWNPKYWELRPAAIPYFERLKEVGIFHSEPESAVKKITEIWPDVSGWWNQDKIQKEREFFCEHFAKTPERPLRLLRKILTSVSK